jgi:hypothetical protein
MKNLIDLGCASRETKTQAGNSIVSNANFGDPFTGPNSPRYCYTGSVCTEIYVRDGKTRVDGNVFSLRSADCLSADRSHQVYCSFL